MIYMVVILGVAVLALIDTVIRHRKELDALHSEVARLRYWCED